MCSLHLSAHRHNIDMSSNKCVVDPNKSNQSLPSGTDMMIYSAYFHCDTGDGGSSSNKQMRSSSAEFTTPTGAGPGLYLYLIGFQI